MSIYMNISLLLKKMYTFAVNMNIIIIGYFNTFILYKYRI